MALRSWEGAVLQREKTSAQLLAEQPREVLEAIILDRLSYGQVQFHIKKQRALLNLGPEQKTQDSLPPAMLLKRAVAAKRKTSAGNWAGSFFRSEMDALRRAAQPELEGTVLCLQLVPSTLAALELLDGCGRKHSYPYGTTPGAELWYGRDEPDNLLLVGPHDLSMIRLYNAPDRAVLLTCSDDGRHMSLQRLPPSHLESRVAYRHDGAAGGGGGGGEAAAVFVHPAMRQAPWWPQGAESLADLCWTVDLLGERSLSRPKALHLAGAFLTLSRQPGDAPAFFQTTVRHLFYPHVEQLHALCLVGRRHGLAEDILQRIGGAMMHSVAHRVAPSRLSKRVKHVTTDGNGAAGPSSASSSSASSAAAAAGPSSSSASTAATTGEGAALAEGVRAVVSLPPAVLRSLMEAFDTNSGTGSCGRPRHFWRHLRIQLWHRRGGQWAHGDRTLQGLPTPISSSDEEEEGARAGGARASAREEARPPFRVSVGFHSRPGFPGVDRLRATLTMNALSAPAANTPIDPQAALPSVWLRAGTPTPSVPITYHACEDGAPEGGLFAVLARLGSHAHALVSLKAGVRLEMHSDRVVLVAEAANGGVVRAEAFQTYGAL